MLLNSAWYSQNATRAYPLDDTATQIDDAGNRLPSDILVDCQLRFPGRLGERAYIVGVHVTPRVVSVVFAREAGEPLAAITLVQPVAREQHYPVVPLTAGVGGFVVFGPGVETVSLPGTGTGEIHRTYSGRFSTPAQSVLAARCAQSYTWGMIRSIDRDYRQGRLPSGAEIVIGRSPGLGGDIRLQAGPDIELQYMPVRIRGYGEQQAVVIQLKNQPGRDVFEEYLGCCDARPESRSCTRTVMETINDIGPDCQGNINIQFEDFRTQPYITNYRIQEDGTRVPVATGITIDTPYSLSEICREFLPEGPPAIAACNRQDPVTESDQPRPRIVPVENAVMTTEVALDQCVDTGKLSTVLGAFVCEELPPERWYDARKSYLRSAVGSGTCVAIVSNPVTHQTHTRFLVRLRFSDSPTRRGGLVFGYQTLAFQANLIPEMYAVILDQVTQRISVEYRGLCVSEIYSVPLRSLKVATDHWYTLAVVFIDEPVPQIHISCLADYEWYGTDQHHVFLAENARYAQGAGIGIISDNSIIYFSRIAAGPHLS